MSRMKPRKEVLFTKWVADNIPELDGKIVAVTGCTSGTGYWAVVAAIRKNAKTCLLLNRKSTRSEAAFKALGEEKERVDSGTELIEVDCDLMSLASVKAASDTIIGLVGDEGLDVLINNAGIAYFPDERTADGFDVQMQVNQLSHFLLAKLLFPSICKAMDLRGEARIVMHSSGARFLFGFDKKYLQACNEKTLGGNNALHLVKRYAESKLANALFAQQLTKELNARGLNNIKVATADPGLATTAVIDKLDGEAKQDNFLFKAFQNVLTFGGNYLAPQQSASDGSLPLVAAAFGKETKSGDFYGPKFFTKGVPTKEIDEGNRVKSRFKYEGNVLNEKWQNECFEECEKVLNVKFFD